MLILVHLKLLRCEMILRKYMNYMKILSKEHSKGLGDTTLNSSEYISVIPKQTYYHNSRVAFNNPIVLLEPNELFQLQ